MKRIIFLDTYGTDEFTVTAISSIQQSRDTKARSRSFIDALRREGNRRYTESNRHISGQQSKNTNRAGINGDNVANTEVQEIDSIFKRIVNKGHWNSPHYGRQMDMIIKYNRIKPSNYKYNMALSETKIMLIAGLKNILTNKDEILTIALMLKSEMQMEVMLWWIHDHYKENPSEDLVILMAKKIAEKVQ